MEKIIPEDRKKIIYASWLILSLVFIRSASAQDILTANVDISIYQNIQPGEYGRAIARNSVTTLNSSMFQLAPSLPVANETGIITAILFDRFLIPALDTLAENAEPVRDRNIVLSYKMMDTKKIYRVQHLTWGMDLSFSLESASQEIINVISETYRDDSYNRSLVLQEYRENPVIRIYDAEDVIIQNESIDFNEILLAATVIGKSFQPLLGIHDCVNLMENITYVAEQQVREQSSGEVTYRDYIGDGSEMDDFFYRVEHLGGEFTDNLYTLVVSTFIYDEALNYYSPPEQVVITRRGDKRTMALLFYDILARAGFETRLVLYEPMQQSMEQQYLVLYKMPGESEWSIMSYQYHYKDFNANIWRIPMILSRMSARYVELDADLILDRGTWEIPENLQWQESS